MTEKKGEKGRETLKPELGVGALSIIVFILGFQGCVTNGAIASLTSSNHHKKDVDGRLGTLTLTPSRNLGSSLLRTIACSLLLGTLIN